VPGRSLEHQFHGSRFLIQPVGPCDWLDPALFPAPPTAVPGRLSVLFGKKGNHMTRSVVVSLALVALISISTCKAEASVATPSLSQARAYALVEKAGVDYCYWKPKKNGQWKLKCED
jgi:hypothetical protein